MSGDRGTEAQQRHAVDDPVFLLPFLVGLVRAAGALALFVRSVARTELPDPIAEQPRVLRVA